MSLSYNILLVEDNKSDAAITRRALSYSKDVKFSVDHVESIRLAEQYVAEKDCDAILLDMNLPDSRSLDTIVSMKRAAPRVPVIIVSGVEDLVLANQTLVCGASDFVVKDLKGDRGGTESLRALGASLERKIGYAITREKQDRVRASLFRTGQRDVGSAQTTIILNSLPELEKAIDEVSSIIRIYGPGLWEAIGPKFNMNIEPILQKLRAATQQVEPGPTSSKNIKEDWKIKGPSNVPSTIKEAEEMLRSAFEISIPDLDDMP